MFDKRDAKADVVVNGAINSICRRIERNKEETYAFLNTRGIRYEITEHKANKCDTVCGKKGTGMNKNNTKATIIAVIAAVVITAIVLLLLGVGGSIEYQFDDSSFSIHTKLWKDRTVAYVDIESIELRDDIDVGKRTNGYGSGKLNLGSFQNDEFGAYQLYSYTECREFVVLQLKNNSTLVINGEDKNATHDIFEKMTLRIGSNKF